MPFPWGFLSEAQVHQARAPTPKPKKKSQHIPAGLTIIKVSHNGKDNRIGLYEDIQDAELREMIRVTCMGGSKQRIVGLKRQKDKKDKATKTQVIPLSFVAKRPGEFRQSLGWTWDLVTEKEPEKKKGDGGDAGGTDYASLIFGFIFKWAPYALAFFLSWRGIAWFYESNITPEQVGLWFADTFLRPTLRNIYKNGPAFEILNVSLGFWAGKDIYQICSEMHPGTEAIFWKSDQNNAKKCAQIYKKKEEGFVSIIEGFFYLYMVFHLCQFFWKTFQKVIWTPLGGDDGGDD